MIFVSVADKGVRSRRYQWRLATIADARVTVGASATVYVSVAYKRVSFLLEKIRA
jgi:hypothetical protein